MKTENPLGITLVSIAGAFVILGAGLACMLWLNQLPPIEDLTPWQKTYGAPLWWLAVVLQTVGGAASLLFCFCFFVGIMLGTYRTTNYEEANDGNE